VGVNRGVGLLVCLLLVVSLSAAQSPNGTVSGIVLDPSGALIVGANVLIINNATGVEYPGKANGEGYYVVPNIPPGNYRIQVSNSGFKTIIKPDIVIHVEDALAINFTLPIGAASEIVTVQGGGPLVNTEDASVSTVVDRQFVENLPLNGRSFNTLLQLTPSVVIVPVPVSGSSPGQFSIAGQRSDSNNFSVDGVSANFGVGTSSYAGQSGTGSAQAFSALGGTSSLVSVEALQEFRVATSSFAPEFGRSPGGQVILTTRSGTNEFHGGLYEYFRNNVLDANDWFANQAGEPRAPERHNDFGGFLGGPFQSDKTFFFISYEGARLRQPNTQIVEVPSEYARTTAPSQISPFLNVYPKPDDLAVVPGVYTSAFTGNYSNPATLNAGSIRIDHIFNSKTSIFGRYNQAPSGTADRENSLSQVTTTDVNTRTLTIGLNTLPSRGIANALRGNYSTQDGNQVASLDSFGGATPPPASVLIGSLAPSTVYSYFETFDAASYEVGPYARNHATQLNFVDDLEITKSVHSFKFGADERVIYFQRRPGKYVIGYTSDSVQQFIASSQANISTSNAEGTRLRSQSLSLYAQDTWKIGRRVTLVYGVRWELAPAPVALGVTTLASWENVNDPPAIALAPTGTPLWHTSYTNFAPRLGIAYRITDAGDLVVRVGGGVFYDLGVGSAADLGTSFPNYSSAFTAAVPVPFSNPSPYLPPAPSLEPPYAGEVLGFSPNLQLPRSYQWNLAIEKSIGPDQAVSITYAGQAGRRLLRQEALYQPNVSFSGDFQLTNNSAISNYDSLQVQYRKRLSKGLQALLNYTFSHSLDDASNDTVAGLSGTVISGANDYASSDFDVRHSFSAAVSYELPTVRRYKPLAVLTQNWTVDAVVIARTGLPFNGIVVLESPDPGGSASSRPDLVAGEPFWISNSLAPGGKSLNPNAFSVPTTPRQGTEGRNDIPGFGLTQVDLSVGRAIPVTDRVSLKFRADAFNVLNHPNFTNPPGYVEFGTFYLQSLQMLNQGLGGLNPLFQEGGPRSLQLSLKLNF
jgi:Carboxypeptidase regulatory-like domain/TonB dependent receptor